MKRLLVVGRSYDFSTAPYDGFVLRHRLMMQSLARRFELVVQPLDTGEPSEGFHPQLPGELLPTITVPSPARDKAARLLALARPPQQSDSQTGKLTAAVVASGAQGAVTLGPWLDVDYAPVYRLLPTVHVFEEDVTRMVEIAPQSRQARALRRAERFARRHRVALPDHVVVISGGERASSRHQFGRRTPLTVIPQTLLAADWPLATSSSQGDYLFCVGALNQTRQSEGLVAFLEALRARGRSDVQVVLLSGGGLHPDVDRVIAQMPQVRVAPADSDVYALYRNARMALVPALRATGMKATILQGWTAGCPVVTYTGSARTLGFLDAVVAAETAEELVGATCALWDDPVRRERLAGRGLAVAEQFDHDRWFGTFVSLVEGVTASAR